MIHETYDYSYGVNDTDRTFCVDPVDAFTLNGTLDELQQCSEGFVPARFSVNVYPGSRTTVTIEAKPDVSFGVEPLDVEFYKAKKRAESKALEKEKQKAELEERQKNVELEKLREHAEQGNAKDQNALGSMYEEGEGVPQDYEEAMNGIAYQLNKDMQTLNTTSAICTTKEMVYLRIPGSDKVVSQSRRTRKCRRSIPHWLYVR